MQTKIRFLHVYPTERSWILPEDGAVDIWYNDEIIVRELRKGEVSESIEAEPGNGILQVYPAGNRENILISSRVIVPDEGNYTLVLADREGAAVLATVREGEIRLDDGFSGIRFGHLISGAGPVRIVLIDRFEQGENLYEDVEYGQITEYIVEEEAPVAFDIYANDSEERLLRIPWQMYRNGMTYTVFLTGPEDVITLAEQL